MSASHEAFQALTRADEAIARVSALEAALAPLPVTFRTDHPRVPAPSRAHHDDAGWDLRSDEFRFTIDPGEYALVSTGVYVHIPPGVVGLICPRSGLAANTGVTVFNGPGVIDAGYEGEIIVNLVNLGELPVPIRRGERIAQILFARTDQVQVLGGDTLEADSRGTGGHGSSGR